MFILNPDPYLLPSYRISPFTTGDIGYNLKLPTDLSICDYFGERFSGREFLFTENGREALNKALAYYNLKGSDIVTILTTSGNFYISSCVTREIEKFCRWSREIEPQTKVIILNHEFGFPSKDLAQVIKTGIPVIEDCAHSFYSEDSGKSTGRLGDFAIYSFPKMFPIQIGGLLVSRVTDQYNEKAQTGSESKSYIKKVLSHYIKQTDEIIRKRIINYNELKSRFASIGFSERFTLADGSVPGVYMFRTDQVGLELPELKKYFQAHGIQCSVFYGENAFFIPCHQNLHEEDLSYFLEVMKSFIINHLK